MKRSVIETLLGAVVLFGALYFLVFSYQTGNVSTPEGFNVYADFAGIGGLKSGDDVQISGVKVGKVASVELSPDTYLARVHMSLDQNLKLPADSAALISSESLLGGKYMAIQPGADEELIPAGGKIQYTQAPQNLEELLGRFIFSMQDSKKEEAEQPSAAPAPAPALDVPVVPAVPVNPQDNVQ
jgi:phospholipid/cholesterol/gamma-HCH transport system substrate-binding protein